MLKRVDTVLAPLSWLAAATLAVMLLAGPQVIAHDDAKKAAVEPSPYSSSGGGPAPPAAASSVDAKQLFADNCGSCHTLAAAGTTGIVGPSLDDLAPDAKTVEDAMKNGPGSMPEFDKSLDSKQVRAIAEFVASR